MQNQSNNQAYKERGIRVGSKIRCFSLMSGNKQDGSMWAYFSYAEKDGNKNTIQKYNVWIKNEGDFIANFPGGQVDVNIDSIQAVRPENKTYFSKKLNKNVSERVINIDVIVSIANVWSNTNNNANYQQNSYINNENSFINQDSQHENNEVDNYNDIDINDDGLPF